MVSALITHLLFFPALQSGFMIFFQFTRLDRFGEIPRIMPNLLLCLFWNFLKSRQNPGFLIFDKNSQLQGLAEPNQAPRKLIRNPSFLSSAKKRREIISLLAVRIFLLSIIIGTYLCRSVYHII
jgi:hypothetical protein